MTATEEAIVKDPNYVVRVAKNSSMQETLEVEATPGVTDPRSSSPVQVEQDLSQQLRIRDKVQFLGEGRQEPGRAAGTQLGVKPRWEPGCLGKEAKQILCHTD